MRELIAFEVGKNYERRGGGVALVTADDNADDYPICAEHPGGPMWHSRDGRVCTGSSNYDLIAPATPSTDELESALGPVGAVAWITPQMLDDFIAERSWTAGAFGEFSQRQRDDYTVPLYTHPPARGGVEAVRKAREWHLGDKYRFGDDAERMAWQQQLDLYDAALAAQGGG